MPVDISISYIRQTQYDPEFISKGHCLIAKGKGFPNVKLFLFSTKPSCEDSDEMWEREVRLKSFSRRFEFSILYELSWLSNLKRISPVVERLLDTTTLARNNATIKKTIIKIIKVGFFILQFYSVWPWACRRVILQFFQKL